MKGKHETATLSLSEQSVSLCLFAADTLRHYLQAMLQESAGVRQADDPECIHRMRVAARRLRSLMPLFAEHLPRRKSQQWRQSIRDVMRALGPARDADVQIACVQRFGTACTEEAWRPGIERLLLRLQQQRQTMQQAVMDAVEQMDAEGWAVDMDVELSHLAEAARVQGGAVSSHTLYRAAQQAINAQLETLRTYEAAAQLPEHPEGLHAMRLATKRLRYPLQAFASLYEDALGEALRTVKTLQDMLGDVHDCDMWAVRLPALMEAERARTLEYFGTAESFAAVLPGLLALQQERQQYRLQRHAELLTFWRHLQEHGVWENLQRTLAAPLAPASAQTRQSVLDLAHQCQYEQEHAEHVTRLALKLFDALQPLHGLSAAERCWLEYAALLHDIGWVEGRRRHHKVALRRILDSPLLPFDSRERLLLGGIVRYHRRALPSLAHEHFAALAQDDQQTVSVLAGILRVADGLDRTHHSVVQDLTCEVTAEHILVHCVSTAEPEPEQQSAMAKGRLLEKALQRALVITW